jgi:hypothetical protein
MSVRKFHSIMLHSTMVIVLLAAGGFGFEAASQGTASPSFTEVVDSLDLATKTSLYVSNAGWKTKERKSPGAEWSRIHGRQRLS